ncbi:hypothetical protein [Haloarchaeobius amylolyticus]|uniref:hypothetical protein n=1 Tax=Haloarchaeobius amylolyticus TaxID=1198296 RepID=UPI00226DBB01|nr:hypothetical protein [Haloarchaeobius amylolyticus]
MGTLALDIETASPHGKPPEFTDTDYFELVAVAAGYAASPDDEPETTVFLREGGWDPAHTAAVLRDVVDWVGDRPVDRTLTYNGTNFDEVHLRNWAAALAESGEWPAADSEFDRLFSGHIDLAEHAGEAYQDRLRGRATFPKLEKLCRWEGIDTGEVRYAEYDLDEAYLAGLGITEDVVQGRHIGTALGAAYVEGVENGLAGTATFRELERLLREYATGDIVPLFELDAVFGHPDPDA